MNKSITILIIIVIILVIVAAGLFYFLTDRQLPFVGPGVDEKTPQSELDSLINNLGTLNFPQMREKIDFIEANLPFNYKKQEFVEIDEVKQYVGQIVLSKTDYNNKREFKNSFNYTFSSLFSELINDDFRNINSYAYYSNFKKVCPLILESNLKNYQLADFETNIVREDFEGLRDNMSEYTIADEYYACQAVVNNVCSNLSEEQREDSVQNTTERQNCINKSSEILTFYYTYLSQVSCDKIDFSKIAKNSNIKVDYNKYCKFARRELNSSESEAFINSLNSTFTETYLKAYLEEDLSLCESEELKSRQTGSELELVRECKVHAGQLLAISQKDKNELKEIDNIDLSVSALRMWFSYLFDNYDSLSKQLDEQVTKNKYRFNFKDSNLTVHCENEIKTVLENACAYSVKGLEKWFSTIN